MKNLSQLYEGDKPREKLLSKGAGALKSEELMAILLGSGVQGKDVRKLSREIVGLLDRDFENLSVDKLTQIHGLGVAKASVIIASIELSRRYLIKSNKQIKSAQDVYGELREYSSKNQEYFLTITLDGASHIINTRVVFIGTLNQSLVHPREVFAPALTDRAASIIVSSTQPPKWLFESKQCRYCNY